MVQKNDIWKFNDDDWKVHIQDKELYNKVVTKFNLNSPTIYYENGVFSEETSWDVVVPNKILNKVKKFIKEIA
tara:strand:+ start:5521 stop:5739 length:219 start_codon:yes stop_codon:yes gene_type:complete